MAYTENATCGIRRVGDHWRHFHDGGDHPGLFADAEAARGGCNVLPEDAVIINRERLLTAEDVRAAIRKRLTALAQKDTN
jgi:hypothetical protein